MSVFWSAVITGGVGFAGLYLYLNKRGLKKMKRVVARVNQAEGTNFTLTRSTVLDSPRSRTFILFDQKNRKLMFYSGEKRYFLRDYDYLCGWQLLWVERSTQSGLQFSNVRFEFRTSDLNQPVFYIPMTSKREGDVWNHRLSLLLNG